ncbi:2-hydroxyacid dehydrogenase [Pseudalkalibacillus hwajinpoensis]|uniref:D-glycerate dehydrogenase n=1 Tax=Guptibacillus hwajinpoensis TaxID=208199 RepID=A0A4U1MJW5_9BACL|nr:D-glycerate dehydrogenase [Pseudalkalibacillus hwajinpoensis]TKD70865.1 D-glycerate dehydrogenase [Pseudalkalibacillus hwajinpoensis]
MKSKIYITRKLPDEIVDRMRGKYEVRMWGEEEVPVPREVLEEEIEQVDGLFCLLTEQVNQALLEKANNLKVVANMAVGYNNIDVDEAKARGITVTNTPGVLTETTADLTFALMMAAARRIPEASDYLREGKWETWSPMQLTGQDIHGATLGIIGLGRIGEAVAKRARGFDMNVLYHNRSRNHEAEDQFELQYVELDELLRAADFVCVLTPFTAETENMIGREQLALMKESAVLINTARGGIVNEEALYDALKNKEIWAAGLDVFAEEPVSVDHPLLSLSNLVTLPHIGSASIKTRMKMAEVAAANLMDVLNGKEPPNKV